MKLKRLTAYIIDMIIVVIISSMLFTTIYPKRAEENTEIAQEILESFKRLGSSEEKVDSELQELSYRMEKVTQPLTIIQISVTIIYFIFLQYFMNGQTLGKKALKIRVKQEKEKKLIPSLFVLRETILLLIPTKIIQIICLMELKMTNYYRVSSIIQNINLIVYLAIIGTIIFREDERGLHDLIGKTKVVKTTKKKEIEEDQ